tara:strand:+ start:194 stop:406 length:213 start_codon:yes stop_codon:yes gene_type:complete
MAAPEGYDTPTIPGMDDLAGRKAWFEGTGAPVQPDGYGTMASDDPQKVAYDASVTEQTSQIAALQALIDA